MPNLRRTRLNAFWMFVLFVIAVNVLEAGVGLFLVFVAKVFDPNDMTWAPKKFIIWEFSCLAVYVLGTWLVAQLQKRRLSELGYSTNGALGQFVRGSLLGIAAIVALVGGIAALGGFSFGHLAMSGSRLISYTIAWLLAFLGVGLAEEAQFRAAGQFFLAESIGPWPAIAVISILFGAIHYFQKPMENLADAASVTLLGAFMGFTVLRSGSIWFAVGFHAFFDYFALFVFGAPNSGNFGKPVATKLLTGEYHGAAWLTGGPLGVEASWLVFPVIALLFLSYHLATRSRAAPAAAFAYNPATPNG